MDALEIFVIAGATLLGPILAVQAQKFIERAGERRRGKLQVFYVLMATRATRVSQDHVNALNRIDLEFGARSKKDKAVRAAWREYSDKLSENLSQMNEAQVAAWSESRDAFFIELLFEMSKALGFAFDRVQIRRGIYYPIAYGELERRQENILSSLERVLSGQQSIPMAVKEFPGSAEVAELQAAASRKMLQAYGDDGVLSVRILDSAKPRSRG